MKKIMLGLMAVLLAAVAWTTDYPVLTYDHTVTLQKYGKTDDTFYFDSNGTLHVPNIVADNITSGTVAFNTSADYTVTGLWTFNGNGGGGYSAKFQNNNGGGYAGIGVTDVIGSIGIESITTTGTAVFADSSAGSGTGIRGLSGSGRGLWGESTSGSGIIGSSVSGASVEAGAGSSGYSFIVTGTGGNYSTSVMNIKPDGTIATSTSLRMVSQASNPNTTQLPASQAMLYFKGTKWVLAYNKAGSIRNTSIDMNTTGSTWTAVTTTAP